MGGLRPLLHSVFPSWLMGGILTNKFMWVVYMHPAHFYDSHSAPPPPTTTVIVTSFMCGHVIQCNLK
jgi:hypothetical protein